MKKSQKFLLQLLLWLPLFAGAQTVSTFVLPGSGIDDCLLPDSAGNLYGSGYINGNVYKVSPGGAVSVFASGFSAANGLAWDGLGNLAVCDNTGAGIYKIAPDSSVSLFLSVSGPSGMIKDPLSDTLYFTTYPGNAIYKVAPDTSLSLLAQGSGLNGPVGMAWDEMNRLIVGNFGNGMVFRIGKDGSVSQIGQFPLGVLGFLVYREGYIYGTMFNGQKIYRMDTLGNSQWVAGSAFGQMDGPAAVARFSRPNGIALSLGGDSLFISDFTAKSIRIVTGLDSVGIVANEIPLPPGAGLEVSPHPVRDQMRVGFDLPASETVSLRLFDLQGREVRHLEAGFLPGGRHALPIGVAGLPRGIYLLSLETGDARISRKVVLQ